MIVGAVLDVMDASVVAYAFLLCRRFVGVKWMASPSWDDESEGGPAGDVVLALVLQLML